MNRTRENSFDVIVIGARCAGSATAMLLARMGARVLVVDRDAAGTDTMSTHALMRGGVFQLAKWGLLGEIQAAGTPPIRQTSFAYGAEVVTVDIRPANGTDALYAPRRTVLDRVLARAASAAGAQVRHEVTAKDLLRAVSGAIQGVALAAQDGSISNAWAPLVIGADGRRSWLSRRVASPVTDTARHSTRVTYALVNGLPNHGYEWFYEPGAGGGLIPTNNGQSVVFLALSPTQFEAMNAAAPPNTFASVIRRHIPALSEALKAGVIEKRGVTFSGAKGIRRDAAGDGWALVGDAGYFKDPLTAHGITDAFRDAELLAEAIGAGRLQDYTAERDALTQDFFRLTDRIASFDWSLDELKDLHLALNKAMKPTQERCAQGLKPAIQAA